jgi:ribosome-associated toxin RatA of RatAB toxin-antitoxin module
MNRPTSSRRALLAGAHALGLALLGFAWIGLAAAAGPIRSVEAKQTGDTWTVDAIIFAPVPPDLAYSVLTDFDHMGEYVPNVRESHIVKREGNKVTIEQKGSARLGIASVPYVSKRLLELEPASIHSTQLEGNLKRVESQLNLKPDAEGTLITYHIEIVPSALASAAVNKPRLEGDIAEQFTAMVGEMVKRQNGGKGAAAGGPPARP